MSDCARCSNRGEEHHEERSNSTSDRRQWDGRVYQSTFIYASHDVVYSRNPDNDELYVVFGNEYANVTLLPGETLVEACFVDPWFSKTSEDALPGLHYDAERRTVKLTDSDKLGGGIRIVTEEQ